jgi:ribonucleoside-diphosphate reductase alpha chain
METLTDGARLVLNKRYLSKDERGAVTESVEGMFRRAARAVAAAEAAYVSGSDVRRFEEEFFGIMASLEFLPNSPTLMNAGRRLGQLAACFVLPVLDSIESIFEAVKKTAVIHQSGGGTGFSFSRLRPSSDTVGSTGGLASGPVSFMRVFNAATEAIKQGGMRRGANMGVLAVNHPDIERFVKVKLDPAEFTNFNLSVAVTDAFMKAVEEKAAFALVNPRTGKETARVDACKLFDLICECAFKSGEPGLLFMDAVNRYNPTPLLGPIEATNPCGEQPLLPYEACNLGSINLARMIKGAGEQASVDYARLERTARLAVRFLDDVIDVNRYPAPEIEAIARGNRKIGLGVMGFADMLVSLRVPYGSDSSLKLAGDVMGFIRKTAWDESRRLAGERGAFSNFNGSVFDVRGDAPVRNATVTTIAPTGTLAVIAGSSSGIEPFYTLAFVREMLDNERVVELNRAFFDAAQARGFYSDELKEFILSGGSISERKEVPDDVKKLFVTAFDLRAVDHVRMQAEFQRHVDNAVSKTINLPAGAHVADVREAYLLAHRLGCKGITVYRSGTRACQTLGCTGSLYC